MSFADKAFNCVADRDYLSEAEGCFEYRGMFYSSDNSLGVFASETEIDDYFKS